MFDCCCRWYTAGDTRCDECQDAFEPLFNQYGVDLAVFGKLLAVATAR